MGEYPTRVPSNDRLHGFSNYAENASSRHLNRRASFATSRVSLPVVQENVIEERDTIENTDTASATVLGKCVSLFQVITHWVTSRWSGVILFTFI